MYEEFIKAIEAEGLTPPHQIIADGKFQRFDSDNSGKSNGSYIFYPDEPKSGWFRCWKTGTENTWSRGYSETDPVKKEQFQKLIKQRTQERTVKILELHKKAAIKASAEYQDAKSADPYHPYLIRKQIKPVKGLKQDPTTGDLIVPIYCKNGNIISRQTINRDGGKYFLKDGQTKGGYFDFGETTENIVICEGFATGASIFEATGYRVRLAFNCGNLKEVATISREDYPKAHIIIAGDDDRKSEGNPGRTKAIEAAKSISTSFMFPDFGENRPEEATDFNDLYCLNGIEAVRKCFEEVSKHPKKYDVKAINGVFEKDSTNGSKTWSVPKPLPDTPPPPPQLDPEILPQPLADFAKATALENEVSPEAVAAFLLSSIGAVTGSRFCIKPDSRKKWYEFPIRSTALVMEVSQNKSGVFRAAIGPLERLQRSYKEENDKAASEYFYEQEIYERLRKGLLSRLEKLQKEGEPTSQVEQELRNLIPPNVPDKKTLAITAGTRPKIIEILSRGNERGLLIKRDELAGWFAGLDKLGNEGDREFYLEGMTVAFNYDNHTIGRGEEFTPALALSICGTIQKSKLRRLLLDMEKGFRNDGMLQRFMWVCPQTKSFEDFEDAYTRGFCGVDKKLLVEIQNIFKRLDALSPDDVGAINSDYSHAPWIGFDSQAQKEFLAWRWKLHSTVLKDENLSDGMESHLRKSERLVAGLALSFHALKCATTDNINEIPPTVDSDALNRAVDIWDVLRHHANAVYSLGQTSTLEAARLIYARIRKLMDKDSKFSVRDIKQKKWRGIHDDKLIDEVLELLVEKDIVKELETPNVIKGRPPSRRFLVNPLALKETDV